jgi:molybdate transport system ATP-binding protein
MLKVDITKKFPDFSLKVAFEIDREILVLFGSSGAGKSLTLECIAGLVRPDRGFIRLGDKIFHQSPSLYIPRHKRGIGVVFQGYALFPHLTVAQNLAYGIRYAKGPTVSMADMLGRLRLQSLAHRYPNQLSGGQQQRVALGRALIIQPKLLLLDEPFSALDRGMREHLQEDIANLQKEFGLTIIYVTHNLEDAFLMGNKLAVLEEGKLHQIGPIKEVFSHPASRSVAEITGVKNIWEGTVVESSVAGLGLQWGEYVVKLPPANYTVGQRVIFYIRPEDVKVIRPDKPLTEAIRHNLIEGTVTNIADQGATVSITVDCHKALELIQLRFSVRSYTDLELKPGKIVTMSFRKDSIKLIPPEKKE